MSIALAIFIVLSISYYRKHQTSPSKLFRKNLLINFESIFPVENIPLLVWAVVACHVNIQYISILVCLKTIRFNSIDFIDWSSIAPTLTISHLLFTRLIEFLIKLFYTMSYRLFCIVWVLSAQDLLKLHGISIHFQWFKNVQANVKFHWIFVHKRDYYTDTICLVRNYTRFFPS